MLQTNRARRVRGVMGLLLAGAALALAIVAAVPLARYTQYTVTGVSMAPRIPPGHHLWTVDDASIGIGDVVVLRPPSDAGLGQVVSRVVAVGGQTVSVRGGRLYRDGRPAAEPYLPAGVATAAARTVAVPSGALYVLGDNRRFSIGSNFYGPVPVGNVRGRVVESDAPPTWMLLVRLGGGLVVALVAALVAWRSLRPRRPADADPR